MAVSTITLSVYGHPKGVDNTQRNQILRGSVALSSGTYPVGGYALSWTNLGPGTGGAAPGGYPDVPNTVPFGGSTPSSTGTIAPIDVQFEDVTNPPTGFVFVWDNVSNGGAGSLHILCAAYSSGTSGPLVEGVGANANIPGVLSSATIQFTATFARF